MLITTQKDKQTLMEIHSQSGNKLTYEQVKLFSALLFKVIISNYLDNMDTAIPYLGTLKIDHDGDTIDNGMAEANLKVIIEASETLKKEIGSISDDSLNSLLVDDIINKIVLELDNHVKGVYTQQEEETKPKPKRNKK